MGLRDLLEAHEEEISRDPPSWARREYENPPPTNSIREGEGFREYAGRKAGETTEALCAVLRGSTPIYRALETDCGALKEALAEGREWTWRGARGAGVHWSTRPLTNYSAGINCLLKARVATEDPAGYARRYVDLRGTYRENLMDFVGLGGEGEVRFREDTDGELLVEEVCDVKDLTPEVSAVRDKEMRAVDCVDIGREVPIHRAG
jgi:hypothetical protein